MLGVVGELRTVAGFLTRNAAGNFAIEDRPARGPADILEAERTHGLFTGEPGGGGCRLLGGGADFGKGM